MITHAQMQDMMTAADQKCWDFGLESLNPTERVLALINAAHFSYLMSGPFEIFVSPSTAERIPATVQALQAVRAQTLAEAIERLKDVFDQHQENEQVAEELSDQMTDELYEAWETVDDGRLEDLLVAFVNRQLPDT